MNNSFPLRLSASVLLAFSAFCYMILSAHAEDIRVEVAVAASFEPKSATGIVISSAGTYQYTITDSSKDIRRTNDKEFIVSFPVDSKILSADAYATAVLDSGQGQSAYATLRRVSAKTPEGDLIKVVPLCPVQAVDNPVLAAKTAEMRQLVSLRLEKRELLRKIIRDALTDDILKKIQGLEKIFGFTYDTVFSANLPAIELATRLSRISVAIENVDYHKQFQVTPSAKPKTTDQ